MKKLSRHLRIVPFSVALLKKLQSEIQNFFYAKSIFNFKFLNFNLQSGQALILLLVFVTLGIIITSGAVIVTIINSQTATKFNQGENALILAETGVENAIIRILRDPNYSGETVSIGYGQIIVSVTAGAAKTITSQGIDGDLKRTIQAQGTLSNTTFNITSWQEID